MSRLAEVFIRRRWRNSASTTNWRRILREAAVRSKQGATIGVTSKFRLMSSARSLCFRTIPVVALVAGFLLQSGAAFAATTLRVTPGSVSFGSEVFGVSGATSNPKTVTISNSKSATELGRIATFSVGGADPGDFAVEDSHGCMGEALEPGASCPVEVTFTPTSLGARSGTLTVTDSGGQSTSPVDLQGSGVLGALQLPPTLSFGRVQRGTSSTQLVTLSNNNQAALDISSIFAGAGFAAGQNCLGVLAADSTCQVSITFSPPAAKNSKPSKVTGALILTDDAAASPQRVQLSGVAFSATPTPTPFPGPPYGQVNGGLKPIANSSVTLFAAGNGYGSGAISLATATTNARGNFRLPAYTCPAGNPQTYITATGGNPGRGSNPAIGMMALTGPCNSLTSSTFVMVNELTTVAAQWALAQFSDATGQNFGTSSTNARGLTNAVNLATHDLVVSYRLRGKQSNTGIPIYGSPLSYMDDIANILAACVDSKGPSATLPTCDTALTACDILFTCTGTPVNGTTLQAAHAMATSPASNVSNIFAVQGLRPNPPFKPYDDTAPSAWVLALGFTGGGLNGPSGIAVDAAGNVWVANNNGSGVSEFNSSGTAISPDTGFTGGGLYAPLGIAVDAAGNVWATNTVNSISELNSSGSAISPSTGFTGGGLNGGVAGPNGIAVDAAGNVWVANSYCEESCAAQGSDVSEFNSSGTAISPDTGFTGGGLDIPYGIAVDAAGNVWVTNYGNSGISEFNSSGTAISPDTGYTGGGGRGIAVDAAGNVWVADNGRLSEFNSSGISIPTGYLGIPPLGIAVDAGGNVWVTDFTNNSIGEFIGLAKPVRTPLVACLKASPPHAVCLP